VKEDSPVTGAPKKRRVRVIPSLLISEGGLVKTTRFKDPKYVGDPINAVKIFNDKEVDEIAVIDISATRQGRGPNFEHMAEIAGEAFMPMAYGGGIRKEADVEKVFQAGGEKVILNTAAFEMPELLTRCAKRYGSQSLVVSIDVKRNWRRRWRAYKKHGTEPTEFNPVSAARHLQDLGAGEIVLHNIEREGTYQGYDLHLLSQVAQAVTIPVVALGGAKDLSDLGEAIQEGHASAVMAGSLFVFHGPHRAVLINYPEQQRLEAEVFPDL